MKTRTALLMMWPVVLLAFLCATRPGRAAESRRGVDVNETPPLELAWPFFDWVGTAEEFTAINHWRSYYYEHEFHFWLRRDGGERTKMVSRESTTFTDDWRLGPTYLPLEVDWSKNPQVRVIGVKLIDRDKRDFHGMKLPDSTCSPLILYVRKDGKWAEWMVNNWFHDWHKYINPDTKEDHPGLDNTDLAQYYIGKREPYDVSGHMNAISPDLYDDNIRKIQAGEHKGHIYHGFLVADAAAPKGYRIELKHMWLAWSAGLGELPGFGSQGTLKPHFVLPQLREWNFCAEPWPLTLMLDTPGQRKEYSQKDTITLAVTVTNHSARAVTIAVPKGDPWLAFELRSNRRNVSTRPPITAPIQSEVKTLKPGESFTAELKWTPLAYGYTDLRGNDVPLVAHYSASFFCAPDKLGAFDQEMFSNRIHLKIQEAK
jgi:hypothetical protein